MDRAPSQERRQAREQGAARWPFALALVLSLLAHGWFLLSDVIPSLSTVQAPRETVIEARLAPPPVVAVPTPRPVPPPARVARPARPKAASRPQAATEATPEPSPVAVAPTPEPTVLPGPTAEVTPTPVAGASPARTPLESAGFPKRIEIDYSIVSSLQSANASELQEIGTAELSWQFGDGTYEIRLSSFGGQLLMVSEGRADAQGIRPNSYTMSQGGKMRRRVEFDWEQKLIRRVHDNSTIPLPEGTQDGLSVMAHIAWTMGDQPLTLDINDGHRMLRRTFKVAGFRQVTLPMGAVDAAQIQSELGGDETGFKDVWVTVTNPKVPVRLMMLSRGRDAELLAREVRFDGKKRP